ncbi:Sugar transporter ERD6-like 14 [Eumeta japonica]|uniref:Sugar transporter ERD6-like 14 n=1 Tax=Eumeta variegata TaxID=151549 RepID=A0A4C1VB70_EUMVA|nr:Sugar transporter ERD6-like 14 [Eumeta japonica]
MSIYGFFYSVSRDKPTCESPKIRWPPPSMGTLNSRGITSALPTSWCFVTASVATNIVGHGAVIGFSAVLIPQLRLPTSHIKVNASSESWIASVIGFALILGNFIITGMTTSWGRKNSHIATTIPILVGWFMILFATDVAGLIAARFMQGISMGMLGPLGSIIVGEMTDPKNRGAFLTSVSLSLTVGVLFTHSVGTVISWQMTALLCSFVSYLSLLMILFTPESPCWLASVGRYEECREVFRYLRGSGEEQENELEKMISAQKLLRKSSVVGMELSFWTKTRRNFRYINCTIRKKEFYKPIIIMFHLYTMFQFAGINVISSYTMDIIEALVGNKDGAKFWMVVLDIQRLILNVVAVFVMKTVNRRTILFSTGGICVSSYLCKAGYVYAKSVNILPPFLDNQIVPLILIFVYMFSLAVGIVSIPFAVSGEIFALEYRGIGGGISVLALSTNFFVAVKCFPVLRAAVGLPLTYCIYASVVSYCLLVLYLTLPETKDKTLQEIEDEFRGIKYNAEHKRSSELLHQHADIQAYREARRCSTPLVS